MKTFLTLKINFILFLILIFGFILRTHGVNWDQNQHLHPDERFLTMVTQAVSIPNNIGNYLDPDVSTLNPYNANYSFFVYGTLPITLTKIIDNAIAVPKNDYNQITLQGRLICAMFDTFIIFLIFLITRSMFSPFTALIAAGLYSLMVLPIQLAHFFTVDIFSVFFLTASFMFILLLVKGNNRIVLSLLSGLFFGLSLACKISSIYFLPVVALSYLYLFIKYPKKISAFFCGMIFIGVAYLAFRVGDPKSFSANIFIPNLNPQFLSNLKELNSFSGPDTMFPPAIQWIKTKPLIFPLKNIVLWGLGLPLGIFAICAVIYSIVTLISKFLVELKVNRFKFIRHLFIQQTTRPANEFSHFLILFWILIVFFYEGTRFAKTMRYFYPIYPFLAIITANFIYQVSDVIKRKFGNKVVFLFTPRSLSEVGFFSILVFSFLIWPLSFIQIYNSPHSRVTASKWIYKNIPYESTLSCEHWDDCLPLSIGGNSYSNYQTVTLEMFNPDSTQKWDIINEQLTNIDYLILSSNRVWRSIPTVPEKYPIAAKFYNDLFSGKSNFKKVAEITSFPTIPLINVPIDDSLSEEAFTVYDHPKVLIYRKVY